MPLNKQPVGINFAQGLDTKTDKYQVPAGKFLDLQNSVFDTTGQWKKRNGFQQLPSLPDSTATTLTTYRDSLIALGSSLSHLSQDASLWTNRGAFQPVSLSVTSVHRSQSSQSGVDLAVAPNGLSCSTWNDSNGLCYYKIVNSANAQSTTSAIALPTGATQARCCLLGRYFIVTFLITISSVSHLQYVAIPINQPSNPGVATDLSAQVKDLVSAYDIMVVNNNMYWVVNGSDSGGAIRIGYIDSGLLTHTPAIILTESETLVSLAYDSVTSSVWVTWLNGTTVKTKVYSLALVSLLATTTVSSSITLSNLTTSAYNGLKVFEQIQNTYSYSAVRSDYVTVTSVSFTGTVSGNGTIQRGVGLGSKAFVYNADSYVVLSYGGAFQPTYFLYSLTKGVIAKLAYENGGGYQGLVLSSVSVTASGISLAYQYKDQVIAVNKSQGVASVGGIYAQTGVNIATFQINQTLDAREIGQNLHITGGFLWMYDGDRPVEHSFHVWPEDLAASVTSTTTGNLTAQIYNYQAIYAWTDSQGNVHRSAPSVPVSVTTTGTTSSVTINVPTLRLTRKTAQNKARVEIYRSSTAQGSYYLITSITNPLVNDSTVDSVSFTDTFADSAIIGNPLIYTTGSVVENIAVPATSAIALFKSRLFFVYAEDENLIGYTKQVVEGVPVEPTDLFTTYISPTLAPQGSDSKGTVLAPLDDKLIIFKKNALFYITGTGPDNTGANNDFSEPVLITSAVGCTNAKSIAITPSGIQFQSPDKGIWLLGRDLSTTYVGAPVESFNAVPVTSALAVPGTNQVRFTLNNQKALVFDYLMNQWGTFTNINAISSCIYGGKHTFLDPSGRILQELTGTYLDRTTPVLMRLESSWFALAGLQGFQRFQELNLLGRYISPHILEVSLSYDYDDSVVQTVMIYPDNYSGPWGANTIYGGSIVYGGQTRVEDWRIFPETQKCESFKITIQEHYDPSLGVSAGAGLTLSGMSATVGIKKGNRPQSSKNTAG